MSHSRQSRALIAALAVAGVCAVPAAAAPPPGAVVPGEVIVGVDPSAGAAARAALERRAGIDLDELLTPQGARLARVPAPGGLDEALARLRGDPDVRWAEPNRVHSARLLPDDPYLGQQWGLVNTGQQVLGHHGTAGADIGAAAAWDRTTGSPAVRVAVVDGGVDPASADLAPNIGVVNPGEAGAGREANGVDDDRNGRIDDWRGWDFVDRDNDPRDEDPLRHGTTVSGVLGARGADATGIAGVTWTSRIIPLRALDDEGFGTFADLAAAITYASERGARILNASFGGTDSSAIAEAIAAAPQMLVVAAAGNEGRDNDVAGSGRVFPCSLPYENVVCVAATDQDDELADFSNHGDVRVDLAAPGVAIIGPPAGGTPSALSGTSFSAPHVAGVAALVLAANPGATTRQLRRALLDGAERLPSLTGLVATGGRLDAPGALAAVPPADPGPGGATGPADDLGPDAARLTGTAPASSVPLAAYFEYGPTPAYGGVTPTRALAPGAARQVAEEVRDLAPGAPLHHRLIVAGVGGITHGADVASRAPAPGSPATTAPAARPAPVTTSPATARPRPVARPRARVRTIRGRRWLVLTLGERARVSALVQRRRPRAARRAARFATVRGIRGRRLPRGTRRIALGTLRPGRHRVRVRVAGATRTVRITRSFTVRPRR